MTTFPDHTSTDVLKAARHKAGWYDLKFVRYIYELRDVVAVMLREKKGDERTHLEEIDQCALSVDLAHKATSNNQAKMDQAFQGQGEQTCHARWESWLDRYDIPVGIRREVTERIEAERKE